MALAAVTVSVPTCATDHEIGLSRLSAHHKGYCKVAHWLHFCWNFLDLALFVPAQYGVQYADYIQAAKTSLKKRLFQAFLYFFVFCILY